jgi:hypothetical protein
MKRSPRVVVVAHSPVVVHVHGHDEDLAARQVLEEDPEVDD